MLQNTPECTKLHYIEKHSPGSMLINLEMKLPMQIYTTKLDLSPTANPNKNYELLAEQLQIAKSTHMPKKIKRFNKRKHKKQNG